jgi:hypothetical protein
VPVERGDTPLTRLLAAEATRFVRLALSRRGWAKLARRCNRVVPLPTNERGVIGSVATLESAGVRSRRIAPLAAPARRAPALTIESEAHPAAVAASATARSDPLLRVGVLPGWRLETEFGLVLAPTGEVLAESAWGEEQLQATGILSARRLPRASRLLGRHASLLSQWCEHYYHWLADAIPRLLVLEQHGFGDLPLLIPARPAAYQRDSLRLLGFNNFDAVRSEIVQPDELVWPAPAGPSGHPPAWACARIGERMRTAAGAAAGGGRRLLISRNSAAHRRVLNQAELAEALQPFGFQTVAPEELSFADQVRLFAEAQLVVAPHGAGLANMLFAVDATVVEIHEPDNVNLCFYNLADAAGHAYWYVLGERFSGHRVGPSYRDVRAPVPAVVETVERVLADR